MREHDWELFTSDDPATLNIRISVKCRACGSQVQMAISPTFDPKVITRAMEIARSELMKTLAQEFPVDCEEAAISNVFRRVHES